MPNMEESMPPLVSTSSSTPQVSAPSSQVSTSSTHVTIHSIDFDSNDDNHNDDELAYAVSQGEGETEFVSLSSLPSFDDVPASMIESSILDFNKAMAQIS